MNVSGSKLSIIHVSASVAQNRACIDKCIYIYTPPYPCWLKPFGEAHTRGDFYGKTGGACPPAPSKQKPTKTKKTKQRKIEKPQQTTKTATKQQHTTKEQ